MTTEIGLSGLTRDYPAYRYSTQELIDILGNKLSEKVRENIHQLGVENRYFIRPFEPIKILRGNLSVVSPNSMPTCPTPFPHGA